jgi:hypothetical protein
LSYKSTDTLTMKLRCACGAFWPHTGCPVSIEALRLVEAALTEPRLQAPAIVRYGPGSFLDLRRYC